MYTRQHVRSESAGKSAGMPELQQTLGDYAEEVILVQCDQCPGIHRHSRTALVNQFGTEARLGDVLPLLCRPSRPDEADHTPHLLRESGGGDD